MEETSDAVSECGIEQNLGPQHIGFDKNGGIPNGAGAASVTQCIAVECRLSG